MRLLTVEEVLYIHFQVIDRFGGLHGVRDVGGLQSALARPQTTVFGNDAYPSLLLKVSAMLHSLILNHPFPDGNKRTAFATVGLFLHFNGVFFAASHKEMEDFVVSVAEKHLSVESIADWLSDHVTNPHA